MNRCLLTLLLLGLAALDQGDAIRCYECGPKGLSPRQPCPSDDNSTYFGELVDCSVQHNPTYDGCLKITAGDEISCFPSYKLQKKDIFFYFASQRRSHCL